MNDITNKTKSDCVVVSLANYFKKDYQQVLDDLYSKCSSPFNENHHTNGFYLSTYMAVMEQYLCRKPICKHPRRGQNLITGLARFQRAGTKIGHLTFMIGGNVFDTNGKIYTVDEYRRIFRYNLKIVCF